MNYYNKSNLSTQQITEKSEEKIETGIKTPLVGLIKGLSAFILVTLSLFNVFFNSKSDLIADNDKKYDEIVKIRKEKTLLYRDQLKNKILSIDEFLVKTDELTSSVSASIKTLNIEKRKIKQDFSFRGRSSFHFWIFVFGLVTALFYFSCKSLFDEFSKGSTFKHHFVSLSGILVSGFWFVHLIFYSQKDFSRNTYFSWILMFAFLFSIFTYFLIKYYTYKDQIIFNLLSFIDRVKDEHIVNIGAKAIYSEKNGKPLNYNRTVESDLKDFDEDLIKTVDGI